MKAMILAAGRGERLRPLTDELPKPLVPVLGRSLIERHLERLAAAGFRDVIINVSHLGRQIEDRLGQGERFGVRIRYSREAEPLETAGGLACARALLGPAPFLLLNADIYCEYAYAGLRRHALDGRLAHLIVVPNPAHRERGDFSLRDGMLGTAPARRFTYSGVAVVSPLLTQGIAPGTKAALGPILLATAARGELSGELYQGLWSDVGTVERLALLEEQLNQSGEH